MLFAPKARPPLLAGLLAASLGGCASSPSANYVAQGDVTGTVAAEAIATQSARGVDLSLVLAQMPEPGGAVEGLREKVFPNGVRQDIKLAGSVSGHGENALIVSVQAAPAAPSARNQLQIWRPAESAIKGEIVSRFPKLDMQILTQPRRNALGPFGLAIGRDGAGTRCVFAWQWVDDVRNPGATASAFGAAFGSAAQPASIRVHLCRKDASVDDLAMSVEGLTLAAPAVLDRALAAGRANSAVPVAAKGEGGGITAASDGTLEGALAAARPIRQKVEVASAPRRPRVARRKPAPAGETVAAQSPAEAAAPVYSAGPRYLAPVNGAGGAGAPGVYAAAPYAAMGAQPVSKALDSSLPAAAYRGPNTR